MTLVHFPSKNTSAYPFAFSNLLPDCNPADPPVSHNPLTDPPHHYPDEQHLRDVLRVNQSVQTRYHSTARKTRAYSTSQAEL
jgi:hypothetical protein